MSITLQKPRWQAWESSCIQAAFLQEIQHKIMALALGRTVPSVNKKIKNLGLRSPSSQRGRLKGKMQNFSRMEKTPQDLKKMIVILKAYAPLKSFQKGHLALKKGCWAKHQLPFFQIKHKGERLGYLSHYNSPFTFLKPLDFVRLDTPMMKEIGPLKIQGDPTYVPLYYVEQWAGSEGFHKTNGGLQQRGLPYWKDGAYFSQAQLLMHVNRLQSENKLCPIALIEEEKESPA